MPDTLAAVVHPPYRVRAYHVRAALELLTASRPAAAGPVQRRLDRAMLAELEAAAPTAWVAGAIDVAFWRAVQAELGDRALGRHARALTLAHLRAGPLSGLLHGVLRLFDRTPASLLRWTPRGFAQLHEGAGVLRVESVEPGQATLVLDQLHPSLAGQPWLLAVATALESFLDVCDLGGEAALVEPGPGRAVMTLHWRPHVRG